MVVYVCMCHELLCFPLHFMSVYSPVGCAMTVAVTCQPLTTDTPVQYQDSVSIISGGQNDTWEGLSWSTQVFPVTVFVLVYHIYLFMYYWFVM